MAFSNGFIVRTDKSNMFIFSCIITSKSPKPERGTKICCLIFVSLKQFHPHITKL